ncbi:ABC1 kinase family protein [Lyngbya confervoides]|uniref:AarF/ABC1/UbiB kinase family protein n=1 Tax=Lyngbya confervoides BDU141951 TaxID=1574623 RepID=A0ABD4T263_9CYAN|nr:AarF/ABC1/UbiB kinase family protein [Lyngbya confervoides]MCM1982435.1 AarF/ABC1/UbiB kinase family protein [Lyngbya confervoides BDU141951]
MKSLVKPPPPTTVPEFDVHGDVHGSGDHREDLQEMPRVLPQKPSEEDTLLERYDPDKIRETYRDQRRKSVRRWYDITRPLLALFWGRWWDKKRGKEKENEHLRAVQLRETLTHLGPAFIKIGQALSTRPDILQGAYLDELAKLQDQLPPFPNEVAYRFIEEELGAPPEHLFAEISDHPIAAASLGQVYRGKLHSGETVAIKVQRPGLAEQIALDIFLLRGLAVWIQNTFYDSIRTDIVGILDEFAGRLFEEMDYTQEGRNAERFNQLYGQLRNIYVPRIYWDYTHTRVLTMEWITGTKLSSPQRILEQGINASELIDSGIQCSLRQLLEHGFFHADPHPGNLLAMPNGKLAYLDFGMMSEISVQQRYSLINAIVHIVNREFDALAQDYVKLGFLTPEVDLTPIIPALSQVFNNALGASVAELNINSIFEQLSDIMYEYPFRVPAYYALIVRSLLSMEGIAIGVDPDFKVLSAAYPYVAKRLLTDSSPELRESLRDLLLKDGSFRWNRLENLLRNAQNIQDYDLGATLNQAMDFLFSERGEFIRDRIAEELIKVLDQVGYRAVSNFLEQFPLPLPALQSPIAEHSGHPSSQPAGMKTQDMDHLKRIWKLLQDTPGFDAMKLLNAFMQVMNRPETQRLGQRVASGLAQKAIARLVREWLAPDPVESTPTAHRLLPPAT